MNKKEDINKHLTISALLFILCIVIAGLCFWLRLPEPAFALLCLGFFEALIFGIWFKRKKNLKP